MELYWILFGLVGWGLAILLVLILMHMAGAEERAARRVELGMSLQSATPVTNPDSPPDTGDRQAISIDRSKLG